MECHWHHVAEGLLLGGVPCHCCLVECFADRACSERNRGRVLHPPLPGAAAAQGGGDVCPAWHGSGTAWDRPGGRGAHPADVGDGGGAEAGAAHPRGPVRRGGVRRPLVGAVFRGRVPQHDAALPRRRDRAQRDRAAARRRRRRVRTCLRSGRLLGRPGGAPGHVVLRRPHHAPHDPRRGRAPRNRRCRRRTGSAPATCGERGRGARAVAGGKAQGGLRVRGAAVLRHDRVHAHRVAAA